MPAKGKPPVKANGAHYKIRDLCAATGLSAPTIHLYVREGILPQPLKTQRNQALYDQDFLDRLQLVAKLKQTTHFPLAIIRELVTAIPHGEVGRIDGGRFSPVMDAISDRMRMGLGTNVSRQELLDAGVLERDIDDFSDAGLVTPILQGGKTYYSPLDARILKAMGRIRQVDARSPTTRGFAGLTSVPALQRFHRHLGPLARTQARRTVAISQLMEPADREQFLGRIADPVEELVMAVFGKLFTAELAEPLPESDGTESAD